MIDLHNFWLFALASLILNLTPGNDMLYVASRSAGQGSKAGVVSALGVTAGCIVHLLAAVISLSAIITRSALAFDIIKYLGAAYLIYLGLKTLITKKTLDIRKETIKLSYKNIFLQGALINILNPKVALFFLAFLPQFLDLSLPHPQLQILALGSWFNFSGTIVNVLEALLFGKLASWLHNTEFIKWQQKITAFVLIALGIKVALTSRN